MYRREEVKTMLERNEAQKVVELLEEALKEETTCCDEAFYLLGNAYRKQGNWQQALNNYRRAIDLNPDSPAVEARQALMEILEFFNKDMYNQ